MLNYDKELLYAFGSGTTDCWKTVIVLMSADFIVFRTPGHADWSGVGSRDYYPSHTVLIRKGEWCLRGVREEWYGRVSKKTLQTALDAAQARGSALSKIHQDKESTRLP
jgi:hypothetical protein